MQERKQGRRSAETAEHTKCQIMHVAADMFAELGFERVSLRNISEKAGVSHSLIRHHFGSKEQIWKAISDTMDEYFQRYITQIIAEAPSDGTSADRIYHFLAKLSAFTLVNPRPIQFIADAMRMSDKALFEYFLRSKDEFAAGFEPLFDEYNKDFPDNPVNMWEMKWQMLQQAHAATSMRPMLAETWPECEGNIEALLLKHWQLFNKQIAMQLRIPEESQIKLESLEELILDCPCSI